MNEKRATPPVKTRKGPQSSSKFRTPQMNSTLLERRDTGIAFKSGSRASSSRPIRSQTSLDLTGIGNISLCPSIKTSLSNGPSFTDHDTECDLAYSDYLQALMKKELVGKAIKKHQQDISDQLAIQKDNLYKAKLASQKINEELKEIEQLDQVDDLLNTLNNNFTQFSQLSDEFNLSDTLEQLLDLFNSSCNIVSVKNVKIIQNEEDFAKLNVVLQKCVSTCQNMKLGDRNVEELHHLAEVMKTYQEKLESVSQKQDLMNNMQTSEMYKLLKSVSDMYAEKEKYVK